MLDIQAFFDILGFVGFLGLLDIHGFFDILGFL
jgi:hypothetical protein